MFEKEAEEYTKNLLKKLGIKEDMLLENQPKYLRQESLNFVALDVENVTDAYFAGAESREKRIAELKAQIEKMKVELHHRLVSPSHDDSDCLDKIVGLDRLWQFGQEF